MEPGGYTGGGTPAACVLSDRDGICSGPRRFELEFVSLLRLKLYARRAQYFSCQLYLFILQEVIAYFGTPNFFGSGYAGLGRRLLTLELCPKIIR